MKNQDRPAMPATVCIKDESNQRYKKDYINVSFCGLTKLEHASIEAMKGMLGYTNDVDINFGELSVAAVLQAKALLAELDKEQSGGQ